MRKLHIMYSLKCGLHSGFPWCCILWFVFIWWPFMVSNLPNFLGKRYQKWYRSRYKAFGVFGPQRIPCPFCALIRREAKVIKCDCGEVVREKRM